MANLRARAADLRRRAKWCRETAGRTIDQEVADALRDLAIELEAAANEMAEQAENGSENGNGPNPEKTPC